MTNPSAQSLNKSLSLGPNVSSQINKLLPTWSSASTSATITTSTSFELASSHARVTSIKFTKREWVSQWVSQWVSYWQALPMIGLGSDKNAYISNHHTHWKHSQNLKEKIRKDFWLFHSLAYERHVSRRKEFPWVFSFRVPRPVSSHHQVIKKYKLIDKGRFLKVSVLLNFVQMRGRKGPAQNFCHLFIIAFLVNKRSIFPPKWQ